MAIFEIIELLINLVKIAFWSIILIVCLWFIYSLIMTFLKIYVIGKEVGGMSEKEVEEFEKGRYGEKK